MPSQTTHPRYHTGKQKGRVRERIVWRPLPAPAEWASHTWWLSQANALPALECEKGVTHGTATTYIAASKYGRELGYSCNVCGWKKYMLVQEGSAPPCAPTRELPLNKYQLSRLIQKRSKLSGAQGRKKRAVEENDEDE